MSSMPPPPPASMPPPPPPPPSSGGGGGAKKGCIIAAIVVVVLAMCACGGCFWYMGSHPNKMMTMGLSMGRDKFIAALASDVPEEVRQQFTTEYDAYTEFARTVDFKDPKYASEDARKALARPLEQLGEAARSDNRITQEEAERFIQLSREARGAQ